GSTSSAYSQEVLYATSITLATSSPNPSTFGQVVTFTGTVSADDPNAGTPSGTVRFYEGSTLLGSDTLSGSSNQASITVSTLTAGTHPITAVYLGDAFFAGSQDSQDQVVAKASTSTSLASNHNPSVFSQPVTYTATVTVQSPGAGTPTGTVSF